MKSGVISAMLLLFSGLFIGTFGGLQPIFEVSKSILGASIIAIVLSTTAVFVYSQWFANFLPGSALVKGALFGFLVWALFLILGGLFPFFKDAVYPSQNAGTNLFLSLILSTFWGAMAVLVLDSKS